MSAAITYTCCICAAKSEPIPIDGDRHAPQAPGWLQLYAQTEDKVVAPDYDEMVEIAATTEHINPLGASYVRSLAEPFHTTLDICPACRENRTGDINTVVVARFKDRDELRPADEAQAAPEPILLRPRAVPSNDAPPEVTP